MTEITDLVNVCIFNELVAEGYAPLLPPQILRYAEIEPGDYKKTVNHPFVIDYDMYLIVLEKVNP